MILKLVICVVLTFGIAYSSPVPQLNSFSDGLSSLIQGPMNAVKSAVIPVIQTKVQETAALADTISSAASQFSRLANTAATNLASNLPVTNGPTDVVQPSPNLLSQQVVPSTTPIVPIVPNLHNLGHGDHHLNGQNVLASSSPSPLPVAIPVSDIISSSTLAPLAISSTVAPIVLDQSTRQIIPSAISSLPSNVATQVQSQISGLQSQVSSVGGNVVTQVQDQMSSVQSQVASIPSTIGGMLPTGILPSISKTDSTCH